MSLKFVIFAALPAAIDIVFVLFEVFLYRVNPVSLFRFCHRISSWDADTADTEYRTGVDGADGQVLAVMVAE